MPLMLSPDADAIARFAYFRDACFRYADFISLILLLIPLPLPRHAVGAANAPRSSCRGAFYRHDAMPAIRAFMSATRQPPMTSAAE